ncbi:hypothetical protein [Naasia lichenicola]|uniref:PH domain-containing protein n=1 Tax=Naasia lichenicola TaxID=2565933 RepID=A0A4S4FKJ1_9MICO|nr:hypothetical protein [Naasia lichenicola]THG30910.1 hypothetical protein E6C64_09845 [Naasia lichenicola]
MSAISSTHTSVTLRPLVVRVGGSIGLSSALITIPPFAALYFLSTDAGGWPFLLLLQVGVTLIATAASARLHRAFIRIDANGFTENGYFGRRTRTRVEDIGSILIIPVSGGQTLAANNQVFVLDRAGKTRLRVRGQYWGPSVVQAIVTAFDVPVHRIGNAMTPAELRHAHGAKLYAYERHPAVATTALALLIVGICLPIMITLDSLI